MDEIKTVDDGSPINVDYTNVTVKQVELANLRVHLKAFTASVKAMEANPNKSDKVLALERRNLRNIEAKIAELEGAGTEAPVVTSVDPV